MSVGSYQCEDCFSRLRYKRTLASGAEEWNCRECMARYWIKPDLPTKEVSMHSEHRQDAATRRASVERMNWNIVSCVDHGGMACHVNQNGDHIDPKHCRCRPGFLSIYCPIDLHNPVLYTALTLSAIEHDVKTPEERERALSNFINRHATTPTLF